VGGWSVAVGLLLGHPQTFLVLDRRGCVRRFIVEHHASNRSPRAFGDAFGKAEATIEEQLALAGDPIV
jgi:hypothetical protein